MKIVESFYKHYHFIIAIIFYKNRLTLTEENKKQEPERQYSTVLLIRYQNQYPKIWIIPKQIKFHRRWYPKIRKHPQKSI